MKIKEFKSNIFTWLNEPKWLNRLTLYFALGAVIITALHIFFSYSGFLHTDVDSARYMLSALVQGEAAIVALVVTLSLVAVQLAAQSYSARVIEVFRRTPDLWILMGIYGIAMFYGLGVLKLIENPLVGRISNIEGYVAFAYYLGVFAFVALVPYISNILELLKPSTVINMLKEGITKENILAAIKEEKTVERDVFQPINVDMEKDPIQPIIDIVRGSLMKYDHETVREGLRAIGDSTINIIKYEKFGEDKKERILKHISSHLTRLGKLAASREDEDSANEAIINLQKIGETTAEQKLDVATEQVVESLGWIGKTSAEYKLKGLTMQTLSILETVGEAAVKNQLNGSARRTVESLDWIGSIAAKQKSKDETQVAAFYLEELGKVAAEYKLEYAAQQVAMHLGLIGKVAAEHKLEDATWQTASSLRGIGVAAAEKNLGNVTYWAAFSLKEVGIEAANHKLVKTLQQIVKCTEDVLKVAKDNKLHEVPQVEEFFKIINEALSKSEKK